MISRKGQHSPEDKYNFFTYILNKMRLSTEHRQTVKKKEEKRILKERHPGIWVPKTPLCTRDGGCTVQLCGNINVASKWINGEFVQGTKYKEILGKKQRIFTPQVEERSSHPRSRTSTTLCNTSAENIIRKQTTGTTLARRDEEKSISKGKTTPQHGKRYVGSVMEVLKTMARAGSES